MSDPFTYTFDATITVEIGANNYPEGAADVILEIASDNDLAVSLYSEGTLNVTEQFERAAENKMRLELQDAQSKLSSCELERDAAVKRWSVDLGHEIAKGDTLRGLIDEVRAFYDIEHRDVAADFTWDGWLKRAAAVVEPKP